MKKGSARRFLLLICVAITAGLLAGPYIEAAETGNATAQVGKTVKKDKKAGAGKKAQGGNQGGACVSDSGKKWRDGQHCMSKCNEQGSLCDMRICKSASWKPYSSCFGPKSAMPNCPAACD